uniref:Netrin 4 n=1 Tax=Cyclopterus lumpus TaxID=8103 RepID=A0A8C2XKA8_CYCLU
NCLISRCITKALSSRPAVESRCSGRACNPRMGNLAQGRVLSTQSVCGSNFSEAYCVFKETASPRSRESARQQNAASTLQLDLETGFLLTHLILVFRSPRPAAMVLEPLQDQGHTLESPQVFLPETAGEQPATSKYSGASPCTRGEVSPRCPCQAKHPGGDVLPTDHYAIYDFIVKGSCLCNGHADHCVPARGYRPIQQKTNNMVHGKCVCRHNTAGEHCERCAPLYNDQPWQAANGIIGTPHECQKCKCNGHAKSCHFSRGLWLATGRRSGGVCDDCHHDTEGRHCQSCERGFFRDPSRPKTAPDSCKACSCHPVGSVLSGGSTLCNPRSGECSCKPGVGGPRCDSCMLGYWGLHGYGCRPCDCTGDCDPYTGDCISGSNTSEMALFRLEELFSALHHSGDANYILYFFALAVLVGKVMSAHDKGSHAEVEVKVKKVLYQNPQMKIQRGSVTLYPESWTTHGCTCPVLNPGSEYVVAGHEDWKTGRLMINTKSLIKSWKSTLGRKILHILRNDCGRR